MTVIPTSSTVSLAVEDVLQRVFGEASAGFQRDLAECSVYVVPQRNEPRWIILGEPRDTLPVLRSWAPWKRSSRIRWNAVRLSAALNVLAAIPGIQSRTEFIDISYWRARLDAFPVHWSAVIHVGNPSHTRKAILFVIENGERVICAAKVPLIPAATEAILNEVAILGLLHSFNNFPKILFSDSTRGISAQSWLVGKPASRGFTQAHLDLLISLAGTGPAVSVSNSVSTVGPAIDAADFPFDRSVLQRALELLDCSTELHPFMEHGDFAPWNLKWLRRDILGLLDWEWAAPHGLPWQDICRYFYLDDAHFHGRRDVWAELNSNYLLIQYRRRFDIPPEAIAPLTMRYLLREFLMEWNAGTLWLAEYAFLQIKNLIQAVSPPTG
jgi:hypothetical protein